MLEEISKILVEKKFEIYGQENDCINFVSPFNEDRINFSSFLHKKKKKFEQTYRKNVFHVEKDLKLRQYRTVV